MLKILLFTIFTLANTISDNIWGPQTNIPHLVNFFVTHEPKTINIPDLNSNIPGFTPGTPNLNRPTVFNPWG
tara:strand:+ start:118 stop:333 length:216 start_codon:yes stop_codon:yes gene_type:complete